jgi:hypothetical protein
MSARSQIAPAEAAEAVERRAARRRSLAPAYRQLAGFLVALALVVAIIGAWAWAQELEQRYPRGRLWGELLFLVLVLWWGIVVLSSLVAKATRRIHPAIEIPAITTGQALVWAGVTVVALPLAIRFMWIGFLVPLVVSTACAVLFWIGRRRSKRVPHQPLCVSVAVGALALFPLALFASPATLQADLALAGGTTPVPGAAALAEDLRPLLFFDQAERYPPVDIDRSSPEICRNRLGAACNAISEVCRDHFGAICDFSSIRTTWDAVRDWDFVKVAGTTLNIGDKPGGRASAIYYHVFEEGSRLHVDYWWYFAHNPAPVARSVLCGDSLTRGWLGAACAEHPADWEGITLVLAPRSCDPRTNDNSCVGHAGRTYRITEAHYAQHEKVVRYRWQDLQARWSRDDMARWGEGAGRRPLVFVALDSHASYAAPCEGCKQIVHTTFSERRDGGLSWTNNRTCEATGCLQALPTDAYGRPSRWNAFEGRWGAQHCILFGSYCDSQRAPKAPAYQPRYQDPCPAEHCLRTGRF